MSVELQRAVNDYENFISTHGISEDVINAYVQAVQVAPTVIIGALPT